MKKNKKIGIENKDSNEQLRNTSNDINQVIGNNVSVCSINEDEKGIVKQIIEILDTAKFHLLYFRHFDYIYNYKKDPKKIKVMYHGDRPIEINIEFFDGMIILKSIFPFRALLSCIPLVAIYSLEFNRNLVDYFKLLVDSINGEICLEYEYTVKKEKDFDVELFFRLFDLLVDESRNIYQKLQRICSGKIPRDSYSYYKYLIEWALIELKDYDDLHDERSLEFSEFEYENDESGEVTRRIRELATFGNLYLPELEKFSFIDDIIHSRDKEMLENFKEECKDECFDFSIMNDEQ